MIPLWHHELIYENSGVDLCFQCIPELPEHITIDENNNIYVTLVLNKLDIWNKDKIDIHLGQRVLIMDRETLKITKYQMVSFYGCGISKINTQNVYDITKKSNVYVSIYIQ